MKYPIGIQSFEKIREGGFMDNQECDAAHNNRIFYFIL